LREGAVSEREIGRGRRERRESDRGRVEWVETPAENLTLYSVREGEGEHGRREEEKRGGKKR
jgi:hypothetical protein